MGSEEAGRQVDLLQQGNREDQGRTRNEGHGGRTDESALRKCTGRAEKKLNGWFRPISVGVAVIGLMFTTILFPIQDAIDTLRDKKADAIEVKKKVDKEYFDYAIKDVKEEIQDVKEMQKEILRELRNINTGGGGQ